ncbi:hypothetical protein PANTOEA_00295 [Pantoea dispersa]|uniref:hypothetical protein n=1 Tax=Pantoea dispersa TaxID=59814 RepID=UPI0032B534F1
MNGFELLDMTDFYVGSYAARPFWVGERIDIYDSNQAKLLQGIIPEFAAKHENDFFKSAICINGLMLLHINNLAKITPNIAEPNQYNISVNWMDEYLDYVNALQLCVESESIKCANSHDVQSIVTRANDICKVGMLEGVPRSNSVTHTHRNSHAVVMNELNLWISNGSNWPSPLEVNGWMLPHEVVSVQAAKNALNIFSLIACNKNKIRWLSYLVKSKTAYAENDYRLSLILSWFIIESSIRCLFDALISKEKVNSAGMINFLYAEGVISEEFKQCLNDLRLIRNDLIHNPAETVCPSNECIKAGQAALVLALKDSDVDIVSSWRSSIQF